jgi:hypothetical protein
MTILEKTRTYSAAELYEIGKSKKFNEEGGFFFKSSTKITFNEDNLRGKINHENSDKEVEIEEFNIEKVNCLKSESAKRFLQVLFKTDDNLEEIIKTLSKLGNIENSNEIIISTPKIGYRKEKTERYVGIYFGKKMLHIDLYTN